MPIETLLVGSLGLGFIAVLKPVFLEKLKNLNPFFIDKRLNKLESHLEEVSDLALKRDIDYDNIWTIVKKNEKMFSQIMDNQQEMLEVLDKLKNPNNAS